jgi:gamma-glutamyl:cysteine ligase YbdK (ATP-grasp superfamily)
VAASPPTEPLPAFAGVGLELEYAIVDRDSLDVRACADDLLATLAGEPASDVARGALGWSNELVAHVIELKNVAPVASMTPLPAAFHEAIREANAALAARGAMLMPTAMHPWMDPRAETRLWPRDEQEIYRTFDRVFDCRRHGWANLQSMHVNLPFAGDAQFARLHAAIRALLPLVPALAASSPFADATAQPELDHRLEVYRTHADAVPAVVGSVIPDPVHGRAEYERSILVPMYRAIARYDELGRLQHEWLNARGAIARFDRSAIEIRLADAQECPRADVAIAAALVAVVRDLYDERWSDLAAQDALATPRLAALLRACMRDAEEAVIDDPAYRAALGLPPAARTAGAAWAHLIGECAEHIAALDAHAAEPLAVIVEQGTLARRIRRAMGERRGRAALHATYARLCECLATDRLFTPR